MKKEVNNILSQHYLYSKACEVWLSCVKTSGKVLSEDQQYHLTAIASCIHAKDDLRHMSFMNEDGLESLCCDLAFIVNSLSCALMNYGLHH